MMQYRVQYTQYQVQYPSNIFSGYTRPGFSVYS
jgi:hypothetical protein